MKFVHHFVDLLSYLQFWVGLVLGAIFGVVADRTWEAIESRPHVRLTPSIFENIEGERGMAYTIENTGTKELPPFEIVLFHPGRGTMQVFRPKMMEPLRP